MNVKLNSVKNISKDEMKRIKQGARICVDILTQEEYSLLKDKSILKEILEDNFIYLSNEFYFEKRYEEKSTNYIYALSCWVNEISKLNINYEDFKDKLNKILNIDKEFPYIIENAFKYIESNNDIEKLNNISDKICSYNLGEIDIKELINNDKISEIEYLRKDILLAINEYGSNHVELMKCENGEYMIMYYSLSNSFNINNKPYILEGVSDRELEDLCDMYDIGFEEE